MKKPDKDPNKTPDNRKILAVDDTPDNLFLLEAILSDEPNYDLSCAENGQSAIEAVRQSPPDLILLDVMMPDMNGYEVTRQIRQDPNLPYIPILLVTAHEQISERQGLELGADGLVHKPFDINLLLERIEELLRCECRSANCANA